MVNNYDRIFAEIDKEAQRVAPAKEIEPEALLTLVMEIVDLEDQHRTKRTRIKQLIEDRILDAAVTQMGESS